MALTETPQKAVVISEIISQANVPQLFRRALSRSIQEGRPIDFSSEIAAVMTSIELILIASTQVLDLVFYGLKKDGMSLENGDLNLILSQVLTAAEFPLDDKEVLTKRVFESSLQVGILDLFNEKLMFDNAENLPSNERIEAIARECTLKGDNMTMAIDKLDRLMVFLH